MTIRELVSLLGVSGALARNVQSFRPLLSLDKAEATIMQQC
jgi:hypothetical protein